MLCQQLCKEQITKRLQLTVVSRLTTSIECSDISMFTKTEKYLKQKGTMPRKRIRRVAFFFWNFEHLEVKRSLG